MSDVTVRTNLPAFSEQLRQIGLQMERKVVRAATRAAARAFLSSTRAGAPKMAEPGRRGRVPGTLRRAVYLTRGKKSGRGLEHFFVGVRQGNKAAATGRDAFYWRWIEAGHVARGPGGQIKGGTRLRAVTRDRLIAAGVRFVEPRPFLAPAFRANQSRSLAIFYQKLAEAVSQFSKDRP